MNKSILVEQDKKQGLLNISFSFQDSEVVKTHFEINKYRKLRVNNGFKQ